MKKTFRLFLSSVMVGLLIGGPLPLLRASNGDIVTYTGSGANTGIEVYRIDSTGNPITTAGFTQTDRSGTSQATLTQGDLALRTSTSTIQYGNGTVVSATATATQSQGAYFTGFLQAGTSPNAAAVEGSVLCATNTTVGQGLTFVVCTTSASLTAWAGIAVIAASTGAVVNIYDHGWVLALGTGTINAGDLLITTSTAQGFLAAVPAVTAGSAIPPNGAIVGKALTGSVSGSNLIKIKIAE